MSANMMPQRPCIHCGHATHSKRQLCRKCKNGEQLPDPRRLDTDRLLQYRATLDLELMRRRSQIDEALSARSEAA